MEELLSDCILEVKSGLSGSKACNVSMILSSLGGKDTAWNIEKIPVPASFS